MRISTFIRSELSAPTSPYTTFIRSELSAPTSPYTVITPLLVAVAMVVGGTLIIYYGEQGYDARLRWYDMAVEVSCGLLMIVAFCWDWKNIIQIPGDIERTGIPSPFA